MDYSNEKHFVEVFVRKNRRDRILYELTTPQKRYEGISRFCHQAKDLLDPGRIIMKGKDLESRTEFERFIQEHDEICYVLSPAFFPDEKYLTLKAALAEAMICPDALIIMGNSFAVVFGEPLKGGRDKFLLSEKL